MIPPSLPDLILNVDDTEGGRYAKSRILKLAGYRVVEAATGAEALELAAREQPALMLLDVMLPDINGLDVCRRIKENEDTRHILVLQTSASAVHSRDRVMALVGGADSYLIEPIEPEELIANVKALLRIRAAEQARHQAEFALRNSEERFRQMAESIGDVFWIYHPGRTHGYVSPAYTKVFRRPISNFADNLLDWQEQIHPDDRARVAKAFADAMTTGVYDEEFRLLHNDGSITWIHDRGFPVRDDEGRIYRLSGVAHQITDRKLAEQALRDADRRKDEFLAMLAHELRNPLAPIRNAVELLRIAEPQQVGIAVKAREIISRQIDHLSRLVDELLDVSRITHGKVSLVREPISLSSVVRSASEASRPLMEQRQHHFETLVPSHEIWLSGDPIRLSQVLSNLLNNAAKYTPNQGRITLSASQVGSDILLTVRDNGIGIGPEVLPHVFDLFMQATPSLDRSQGGLGVGLSLAQTLARMHDGEITARSAGIGQGSEFTLRLPAGFAGAGNEKSSLPLETVPLKPHNILLIEDRVDAAEGMAMLLTALGHQVEISHDGPSGLAKARSLKPDLIILDIGLPHMDGYELARALRGDPDTAGIKLIALSGYGQSSDKQKSMDAGIDHHLVKPVALEALEAAIAT